MNSQIEKGLNLVKKASPYFFTAVLAARLSSPGIAHADSDKGTTGRELVEFYTQCGSSTVDNSHTVVVEKMKVGNSIQFVESDWGRRLGECGNPAIPTSSMLVRSIDSDSNGILEDIATFPNPCPDSAVGFQVADVTKSSPNIEFSPSSSGLVPDKNIKIGVTIDRTNSRMPRYDLSGVVYCQTQGRRFIPANDRLNIMVNVSRP